MDHVTLAYVICNCQLHRCASTLTVYFSISVVFCHANIAMQRCGRMATFIGSMTIWKNYFHRKWMFVADTGFLCVLCGVAVSLLSPVLAALTPAPRVCQGCRIYLVGTKLDVIQKQGRTARMVDYHDAVDYADSVRAVCVQETSSLTGYNVGQYSRRSPCGDRTPLTRAL